MEDLTYLENSIDELFEEIDKLRVEVRDLGIIVRSPSDLVVSGPLMPDEEITI